jgi:hypothetical protein
MRDSRLLPCRGFGCHGLLRLFQVTNGILLIGKLDCKELAAHVEVGRRLRISVAVGLENTQSKDRLLDTSVGEIDSVHGRE